MDTLLYSLNAVLPILLLISLGYALKKFNFFNDNFLNIANKFVFRIALPALLFYTIYSIKSFNEINWQIILYSVVGVIILFFIGLLIGLSITKDKKQIGVLWQGVFRANFAIIGIPLADALGGIEAVSVVALISAFVVPLINVLAVIALSTFIRDKNNCFHPIKETLLNVIKNPLIISIFVGLFVLWIRSFIPIDPITNELVFSLKNKLEFLYISIKWVSKIASPLALIVLGGTFEFLAIKNMKKQVIVGTISRVIVSPLIILSVLVILIKNGIINLTNTEIPALIALFASPVAVSSAIMAKEMNNDSSLAVQLVVWTTSISIFSVFAVVYVFRSIGLL